MLFAFAPILAVGATSVSTPADAKSVVEAVRRVFPDAPVTVEGTITVRKKRGIVVKELGYSLRAGWSGETGELIGTLSDALGRESSAVKLKFQKGRVPVLDRDEDDFLDKAGRVKGTALTCFDLVMPFIWWDDFELAGREKSRGRDCYIVDFKAPPGSDTVRVRAWIDASVFIVLKSEIFDSSGQKVRVVLVKSFKSIDDQWMIKDLEVTEDGSSLKTIVTVDRMFLENHAGGKK